jgi:hypothetical protein
MAFSKPDYPFAQRRKAETVPRSLLSIAFSAVRFAEELSRRTGIIRELQGKCRRELPAAKTCWRRGMAAHTVE